MCARRQDNRQESQAKPYGRVTSVEVFYRHGTMFAMSFVLLVLGSIALMRAKQEDIPKVLSAIFTSKVFCWMGWGVAILILLFSLILASIMWKIHQRELDRVCEERDRLQEKLLGKEVCHSNRRRNEQDD